MHRASNAHLSASEKWGPFVSTVFWALIESLSPQIEGNFGLNLVEVYIYTFVTYPSLLRLFHIEDELKKARWKQLGCLGTATTSTCPWRRQKGPVSNYRSTVTLFFLLICYYGNTVYTHLRMQPSAQIPRWKKGSLWWCKQMKLRIMGPNDADEVHYR